MRKDVKHFITILLLVLCCMNPLMAKADEVQPRDKKTGVVRDGYDIYFYFEDGQQAFGYQEIDGNHYFFDRETGKMLYDSEKVVSGHWVYYKPDGVRATGWTKHHGNTYYYDENGWMLYGYQTIDGNQYYFDPVTGVMFTGEKVEKGHWVYYHETNGEKATGWTKHHGNTYYYDENGWMLYGYQTIDGKQYYFDPVTGVMFGGERVENGHWVYYSEEDGAKAYGWIDHHGHTYYYNEKGWMLYKNQLIDGKEYYFDPVTGVLKYGFYESDGKIYYIDKFYNKLCGKQVIDGKVVLFDEKTGELCLGMHTVDGETYYYIDAEPYVYTGEIYKNGAWRYFDEKTGAMATGWTEHHNHTYYYNDKGEMQYGHQTIDGEEYLFDKVTGILISINGNRVIDPNKPMVALTFDDGPSSYTPRVLNCLEEYGQAATFFVVGYNASRYGSTMKRMIDMGCEIGNHSNNHPDLTNLSYSGIVNEMAVTNTYIYNATGTYATVSRTPGGSYNNTVKSAISTPIIMWSIDTLDWKTRDTWSTVNSVLNNVKDGDIVLMHDIHSPTITAAEILIPELVARGYQLVTVSELAQYRGNGMNAGQVYYSFR